MANEIVEGETTENTTEEATQETAETEGKAKLEENAEEEATEEATKEEDKSSDLEAKNRQLYERAKKAEEKLKTLEKTGKVNKEKSTGEPDLDYILEVQSATKGLDTEEVDELRLRAKAKGISLSEARKDENFVLWQNAKKEKVAKAKALNPSTQQTEVKKAKTPEERLAQAKTLEEQTKILDELGMNPLKNQGFNENWEEGQW